MHPLRVYSHINPVFLGEALAPFTLPDQGKAHTEAGAKYKDGSYFTAFVGNPNVNPD